MAKPPSKQLDQFVVRMPDGLRDRIANASAANNRSMNAEIIATLEEKYPRSTDEEVQELLDLYNTLTSEHQREFLEWASQLLAKPKKP